MKGKGGGDAEEMGRERDETVFKEGGEEEKRGKRAEEGERKDEKNIRHDWSDALCLRNARTFPVFSLIQRARSSPRPVPSRSS